MAHNNDNDAESMTTASDLNSIDGAYFVPYYNNNQQSIPRMHQVPPNNYGQQQQHISNSFQHQYQNHQPVQPRVGYANPTYNNLNYHDNRMSNMDQRHGHYHHSQVTSSSSQTVCTFHGSARGCDKGSRCGFSHHHPDSILKCRFYDPDNKNACRWGDNCKDRHKDIAPELSLVPGTNRIHGSKEDDDMYRKTMAMYGYIRRLQSMVSMDNTTNCLLEGIDIDSMIRSFMCPYYQPFWNKSITHPWINIADNTITSVFENGAVSAFSVDHVSQGTHEWKIKVIELKGELEIGIMENPTQPKANKKFWRVSGGFAYFNQRGGHINTAGANYSFPRHAKYGVQYGKGDVISVHLKMDLPELSFSVNGIPHGPIPYQINRNAQYHLAVGLERKGDIVQFIE